MTSESDVLFEIDAGGNGDQGRSVKRDVWQGFVRIDGENFGEAFASSEILCVCARPRKSRPRLVARYGIEEEQVQFDLRPPKAFAGLPEEYGGDSTAAEAEDVASDRRTVDLEDLFDPLLDPPSLRPKPVRKQESPRSVGHRASVERHLEMSRRRRRQQRQRTVGTYVHGFRRRGKQSCGDNKETHHDRHHEPICVVGGLSVFAVPSQNTVSVFIARDQPLPAPHTRTK